MGNSKVMGSAMVVAGDQMSLPLSIFKVWDYFDGEGNGNPLQYTCLGKSHGRRSLVGYSPWSRKESDTTEQLHFHFRFHLMELTV